LPVHSGFGATGLADRGPSVLQRRDGTESGLVEIQQVALPWPGMAAGIDDDIGKLTAGRILATLG